MTPQELVAALKRGEPIPHDIAARLTLPQRGRPRKTYEAELIEAMELIERVEIWIGSAGSPKKEVYHALSSKRQNAASVERYYWKAKRLEGVVARWLDALNRNKEARRKHRMFLS